MIYCVLEVIINYFEQYPNLIGLIMSRVLGGITTNLLFSVFESWLVTEHRRRGFEEEKLEIILRDHTIVSNSAAIISGYIAHCLAAKYGPVGPFEGAVALTIVALVIVGFLWSENYGTTSVKKELSSWKGNMSKFIFNKELPAVHPCKIFVSNLPFLYFTLIPKLVHIIQSSKAKIFHVLGSFRVSPREHCKHLFFSGRQP